MQTTHWAGVLPILTDILNFEPPTSAGAGASRTGAACATLLSLRPRFLGTLERLAASSDRPASALTEDDYLASHRLAAVLCVIANASEAAAQEVLESQPLLCALLRLVAAPGSGSAGERAAMGQPQQGDQNGSDRMSNARAACTALHRVMDAGGKALAAGRSGQQCSNSVNGGTMPAEVGAAAALDQLGPALPRELAAAFGDAALATVAALQPGRGGLGVGDEGQTALGALTTAASTLVWLCAARGGGPPTLDAFLGTTGAWPALARLIGASAPRSAGLDDARIFFDIAEIQGNSRPEDLLGYCVARGIELLELLVKAAAGALALEKLRPVLATPGLPVAVAAALAHCMGAPVQMRAVPAKMTALLSIAHILKAASAPALGVAGDTFCRAVAAKAPAHAPAALSYLAEAVSHRPRGAANRRPPLAQAPPPAAAEPLAASAALLSRFMAEAPPLRSQASPARAPRRLIRGV